MGVRLQFGVPDHLFGVHALAVDHRGHLTITAAGIEADAATIQVASNGSGGRFLRRGILQRAGFYHKGLLIYPLHKMHVKIPQTAISIGFLNLSADHFAAGDDDLIAARHPQQGLDDTLHETEILLVVAGAVGIDTGLIGGGVPLVALNSDNQILPHLGSGLPHFAAHQRHGHIAGVQFGFNLQIHTVPLLL